MSRRVLIPEGFSPRDHLDSGLQRYAARVLALVHLLTVGDRRTKRDHWFVPFHSHKAKRLFGRSETWQRVRECLHSSRVIDWRPEWVEGKYPMGYRLAPEWRHRARVGADLADARVIPLLDELDPRIRGEADDCHRHLLGWLEATTVDCDLAGRHIGRLGPDRRQRAERAVGWFATGVHRPKVGATGRFFTAATAMPRRLRRFLRINGEPIVSCDVANAQPLLLSLIAQRGASEAADLTIVTTVSAEGEEGRRGGLIGMFRTSAKPRSDPDLLEWIEISQAGQIYEACAETFGMPCGDRMERNRVKRAVYCLLMGDPAKWGPRTRHRWDRLMDRWPTIGGTLMDLKSEDHRVVARTLQRAESQIMIRDLGQIAMRDHPEVALLTVHDAALTTVGNESTIRETIRQAWSRYGVEPKVNSE